MQLLQITLTVILISLTSIHAAENEDNKEIQTLLFCNDEVLQNYTQTMKELSNNIMRSQQRHLKSRIEQELIAFRNAMVEDIEAVFEKYKSENHKTQSWLQKPRSCAQALQTGGTSGVYMLYLSTPGLEPFETYCLKDIHNGAAWTIVQRRRDGTENFDRNWNDYKNGFGNVTNEFFIGLERLYAMTHELKHELLIQLEDFDGVTRYAKYDAFEIGNETEKYALKKLGAFSGDVENLLLYHQGQEFTTKDKDNDDDDIDNCAEKYKSGWWFEKCYYCNLNGVYALKNEKGVSWITFATSLKYAHMAIRPVY